MPMNNEHTDYLADKTEPGTADPTVTNTLDLTGLPTRASLASSSTTPTNPVNDLHDTLSQLTTLATDLFGPRNSTPISQWRQGLASQSLIELNLIRQKLFSLARSIDESYDAIGHTDEVDQSALPPADLPTPPTRYTSAVAIIIGHNSKAKGAYSDVLGISEYPFWLDILAGPNPYLLTALKAANPNTKFAVFTRKPSRSIRTEITDTYNRVDDWLDSLTDIPRTAKSTIETHFNGSSNPQIDYSVTLAYHTSARAQIHATLFQSAYSKHVGTPRNLGARKVTRYEPGGLSLSASSYPSILIEPFFGSAKGLDFPKSHHDPRFIAAITAGVSAITHHLSRQSLSAAEHS